MKPEIKKQIEIEHKKFFEKFGIDSESGILAEYTDKRFATYPYIGSKYFSAKIKILFVGLDVGRDEFYEFNRYQTLEERQGGIECDKDFNPHIAGTYCSALYLLKEKYCWENTWAEFSKSASYYQAAKTQHHEDGENPLSFVALTNRHKFVTIGRDKRTGGGDRKFLKHEDEKLWLLKEIETLKPDIVFFQGKKNLPNPEIIQKIKEKSVRVKNAPHPSYRGGRNPETYVKTICEI